MCTRTALSQWPRWKKDCMGAVMARYVPENSWKNRASSKLLYKSNTPQVSMVYLRLTHPAIELSGFTCTSSLTFEQEISIPHEAAEFGIENFEFIVSERVH